ncbi:MAG: insulinase family protein, partial [Deltaproteobacteria bacterium]
MRVRRLSLFILCFTAFLLLSINAKANAAFREELGNGLTVIVQEEHSAPVAAIQLWVKVGSADETEKEAGISHVFEHMLFKGMKK